MQAKNFSVIAKVSALALMIVAALVIASATASAAEQKQKGQVDVAAPNANQATNWGGETAVPTGTPVPGWTESVSNGYTFSDSATVHSGLYSIHMETSDSSSSGSGAGGGGTCPGGVRIPVTPGTNYTWTSWTNVPPLTGNLFFIRVQVTWWTACTGGTQVGSAALSNENVLADSVWRFVKGSGTAPATGTFARIELMGRSTSGTFTGYFDDVTFDVTTNPATPAVQWAQTLPAGGSYLAAPAVAFESPTASSLIFIGGNSGSHVVYRATATATPAQVWTTAVGSAIQNRASVITIGTTRVVYFTSQNGCVNAFNAVTGTAWWPGLVSCINVGSSLLAGVAYQPAQTGGPSVPIIMVATNNATTANKIVALDANTGVAVWTFNSGSVGNTFVVGPINTRPAVGWAPNNAVYFGSNSQGSLGGGLWAVNTSNGTLKWTSPAATSGSVSNSVPVLSSDNATLYIGTDDLAGGNRTFRAVNTTTGVTRASQAFTGTLGTFIGSPWPNALGGGVTDVYFTYGNRIYAVTDSGTGTLPLKTGFGVGTNGYTNMPGGGTPLLLNFGDKNGLFIGGNDGAFYKMSLSTGSGVGRILMKPSVAAVSDATYDFRRDAFYIASANTLYSVRGNWADVGMGVLGGGSVGPAGGKPVAAPDSGVTAPNATAGKLNNLKLYSSQDGLPQDAFSSSIDAALYARMVWSGLRGEGHVAHVGFYSPDGGLYQTVDVPMVRSGSTYWAQLPVSGTWMARMPGRWTVQVTLDADSQVYGQVSFALLP